MIEAINNLICDYIRNNKKLDKKFIIKVVNIIINEWHLDNYVILEIDKINPSMNKNLFLGEYQPKSKLLKINSNLISKYIRYTIKEGNFSNIEKKVLPFFIYLHTILHELDHALRYKNIMIDSDDAITSVLKYTENFTLEVLKRDNPSKLKKELIRKYGYPVNDYLDVKKLENSIFYNINPLERLAECNAYDICRGIIKDFPFDIPKIKNFINYNLYYNLTLGYAEYDSPLKNFVTLRNYIFDWPYLEGFEIKNIWDKIKDKDNNLSIKEKLMLGYEVKTEVLDDIHNKIRVLRKELM